MVSLQLQKLQMRLAISVRHICPLADAPGLGGEGRSLPGPRRCAAPLGGSGKCRSEA